MAAHFPVAVAPFVPERRYRRSFGAASEATG